MEEEMNKRKRLCSTTNPRQRCYISSDVFRQRCNITSKIFREHCYISTITDDILVYSIFARLPARSVVAVRSVCKSWRSLTSSPSFVLSHARRASRNIVFQSGAYGPTNHALIHTSRSRSGHTEGGVVAEKETIPSKLMEFDGERYRLSLLASCDGLLCLEGEEGRTDYVVCNPVTKEWLNVPRKFHNGGYEYIAGFYFHRPTGEYKLLQQYWFYGSGDAVYYEVFSIGGSNEVWRPVDVGSNSPSSWPQEGRVSSHGSIHWLLRTEGTWMVTFDTNSEKFRPRMSLSRLCLEGYSQDVTEMGGLFLEGYSQDLIEMGGGSLGLWQESIDEQEIAIWRLEDYVKEEWVKRYTISLHDVRACIGCTTPEEERRNGHLTPLVAWDDGKELLLRLDNRFFVLYNSESNSIKEQEMNDEMRECYVMVNHAETLVSLNSLKARPDTYRY